ncbi:MAG: AMP-binding protein [Synechococcaceae cyanobacterium]
MTMTLALAHSLDDPQALLMELHHHWRDGALVGLALATEREALCQAVLAAGPAGSAASSGAGGPGLFAAASDAIGEALAAWGPAVVLGSGGSSGGRRWCLQPLRHLEASVAATASWLAAQAIDPEACLHLVGLPLHHVSGLLPLIRCQCWGAELRWLPPDLLRRPQLLSEACALPTGRPVLLSLVPTQLRRLLDCPEAVAWLAGCSVIWVGGSALPEDLARRARQAGLPLSPCYGASETAAMVCALTPQRFLAGEAGCGPPLADVELRLEGESGAIALRTARLSPGWWQAGRLRPFTTADGGWRRGDAGGWSGQAGGPNASLVVRGRLDGAIHSGGETVFPEQVRHRLLDRIAAAGLPVAELLLLPEEDRRWGQRLVALVRLEGGAGDMAAMDRGPGPRTRSSEAEDPAPGLSRGDREAAGYDAGSGDTTGDRLAPGVGTGPESGLMPAPPRLETLVWVARQLPPAERPCRWLLCPELEPTAAGKWDLGRWRAWLARQSPQPPPPPPPPE